jgi:hypothetical protein
MLALNDAALATKLTTYRQQQADAIKATVLPAL